MFDVIIIGRVRASTSFAYGLELRGLCAIREIGRVITERMTPTTTVEGKRPLLVLLDRSNILYKMTKYVVVRVTHVAASIRPMHVGTLGRSPQVVAVTLAGRRYSRGWQPLCAKMGIKSVTTMDQDKIYQINFESN